MKKNGLLFGFALIISLYSTAQEGGALVKIFSNCKYDISNKEEIQAFKGFEIKRAYLGYKHKIDDKFSTNIIFDVGSNSSGSSYTAFLKIASLKWSASEKLDINIGMVGTKNFKFMEKSWGRRYIEKSTMDKYKWASSADAGCTIDYILSEKIKFDAQVLNGEGYKRIESDELFRAGCGLTYNILENIALRIQHDISDNIITDQTITTAAISYTNNKINIGGETNLMRNSENIEEDEQNIISIYGAFNANEEYTLFARYDNASESNYEENFVVYGIERKMTQGVSVALNVQSRTDAAEGSEAENILFLNLEYTF